MIVVSAIITTKNRLELLKRAINSILDQTFTDYEILIIDDNSIDDTKEYCTCLINENKKIRYISIPEKESSGISHARNIGIKNSEGKYIAFLDDDDEWYPEKLEKMVEKFENNNKLGMVFGGIEKITSYNNQKIIVKKNILLEPRKKKNMKYNILWTNLVCGNSNPMIKKEVFETVGYYDENLKEQEDYDMWIRIFQNYEAEYIPELLTKYYFEVNSRIQSTSNLNNFNICRDYIYTKYQNLFCALRKEDKIYRKYTDYRLICERALYIGHRKTYRKYLKKRLKMKFTMEDFIYYISSYLKTGKAIKIKLVIDILKQKKL